MIELPDFCLVDTNVPIVANEDCLEANDSLVEECINILLELTRRGGLVLDDGGLIFEEYRQNLSLSGQPGTGDAFMKWVHDHQWLEDLCERRTITSLINDPHGFVEFPESTALNGFDPSDRKFVAVANARIPKRPIIQAVDCKWWGWKEALAAEGIEVVFVDATTVEAAYKKHIGDA
jgi:hypothetical protein